MLRHSATGAPVTLKELCPPASLSDGERERLARAFEEECRILVQLSDPRIARPTDFGRTAGGTSFLAFDRPDDEVPLPADPRSFGVSDWTVIAAQAKAKISFRLVGDQNPEKIRDAFRQFVRERVPADCRVTFENFGCAPAIQLSFDNPAMTKARKALQEEWGTKAVTVGMGGSIPIVGDFKRLLGMDSLMVGFALDDDRVHSPNEKYDLMSFHKGTRSWARILAALAS